jgi:oligopeptide transport system substrate-binding protein
VGGEVRVGRHHLSRYQFAHTLIQRYLYNELSPGERRLLHREIASVLEELYEGRESEITVQLARHYTEAGEAEKAIENLLKAGDEARALHAHREAIDHYDRALDFLREEKDYDRAARTLMKLGLTHHLTHNFEQAHQAYEEGFTLFQRAGKAIDEDLMKPAPHPLRVDYLTDPLTLDPTFVQDKYSMELIIHLFSGLVTLTPEYNVIPGIAQRWEVLEDGRKYVFHLRDDFSWSDGTQVKAHDFEYAWKRTLNPEVGSPSAQILYILKGGRAFHQGEVIDPETVGVRAVDDMTLELELEDQVGYTLHLLAMGFPLPKHVIEEKGESWTELGNLVTNGPFRLEEWQAGKSMTLSRNPDYPGHFPGNVERVEIYVIGDRSKKLKMYEEGDLDYFEIWPPSIENDQARQRFAGEYVSLPLPITHSLIFNTEKPPFDDPRVREAFALAIDKAKLANVTLGGFPFPATGGFVPPGLPGHIKKIGTQFDPERARELLKEAGYPSGVGFPSVEFLHAWESPRDPILVSQWQEHLGVDIKDEKLSWDQYMSRLDEVPPNMCGMGWDPDYPDPDTFLRVAVNRITLWRNEIYENLVEEAGRESDTEERMKMYHEAEKILADEIPLVPLTYFRWHLLVKPWVRNFRLSGAFRSWFNDIILESH